MSEIPATLRALLLEQLANGLFNLSNFVSGNDVVEASGWFVAPYGAPGEFEIRVNGERPISVKFTGPHPLPGFVGKFAQGFTVVCADESRLHFTMSANGVPFPFEQSGAILKNRFPLPTHEHQQRVQGAGHDAGFLINGASSYAKFRQVAERYVGKPASIVDWGCGCGRILRYFPDDMLRGLIGVDVDPVNIAWCKKNIPGPEFHVVDPYGGFPTKDDSIDFLYGNSVMTHLAEKDQQHWLAEIRRVLRPGGVALITIFGMMSIARVDWGLDAPVVEKWLADGFQPGPPLKDIADVTPDGYYISASETPEYVARKWADGFRLLAIHKGISGAFQDGVVLKKI